MPLWPPPPSTCLSDPAKPGQGRDVIPPWPLMPSMLLADPWHFPTTSTAGSGASERSYAFRAHNRSVRARAGFIPKLLLDNERRQLHDYLFWGSAAETGKYCSIFHRKAASVSVPLILTRGSAMILPLSCTAPGLVVTATR